jgi:hypothetical protein
MKSSDLEMYHLAKQFERLGTCRPAGSDKSMETMIYEALIDLMELSGKITESIDSHLNNAGPSPNSTHRKRMTAVHREFSTWYDRLPDKLRWTPNNIATAPFSFFLLHQQYHACIILLHRPFALYGDPSANEAQNNKPEDHSSILSRTVCTTHAIRIARIYWQHRQRFDTKQIFVTGIQHAVGFTDTCPFILFILAPQWGNICKNGRCSGGLTFLRTSFSEYCSTNLMCACEVP